MVRAASITGFIRVGAVIYVESEGPTRVIQSLAKVVARGDTTFTVRPDERDGEPWATGDFAAVYEVGGRGERLFASRVLRVDEGAGSQLVLFLPSIEIPEPRIRENVRHPSNRPRGQAGCRADHLPYALNRWLLRICGTRKRPTGQPQERQDDDPMIKITRCAPFTTVLLFLALAGSASSLAAAPPQELASSPNGRYRICHIAGSGARGDYGRTIIVTNGTCAGGQSLRSFVTTPYPPTVIRDDGVAIALGQGLIDWPGREVFQLLDPRDPVRDRKVLAGALIAPARFASHTWPTPPMFDKHLVATLTLRIDIPGAPLDVNLATVRPSRDDEVRIDSAPRGACLISRVQRGRPTQELIAAACDSPRLPRGVRLPASSVVVYLAQDARAVIVQESDDRGPSFDDQANPVARVLSVRGSLLVETVFRLRDIVGFDAYQQLGGFSWSVWFEGSRARARLANGQKPLVEASRDLLSGSPPHPDIDSWMRADKNK